MMDCTVKPEGDAVELFGLQVSSMQSGITVDNTNKNITGTLKYVTGYTGFSDDPELQEGNFIALKFEYEDGITCEVGLDPSEGSGLVPLDSDNNGVFRIKDKDAQKFVVKMTKDGATTTKVYDLSGLTCESSI